MTKAQAQDYIQTGHFAPGYLYYDITIGEYGVIKYTGDDQKGVFAVTSSHQAVAILTLALRDGYRKLDDAR